MPALQTIFEEFIVRKTILKYPENNDEVESRVLQYLPLLRALYSRQANLSFKKSEVIAAFLGVAAQREIPGNQADWAERQADALSKWCRRLSQGLLKLPGKWREMLKDPEDQAPAEQWSEQAAQETSPTHVVFDRESQSAYRVDKNSCREYCDTLLIPEVPRVLDPKKTRELGAPTGLAHSSRSTPKDFIYFCTSAFLACNYNPC